MGLSAKFTNFKFALSIFASMLLTVSQAKMLRNLLFRFKPVFFFDLFRYRLEAAVVEYFHGQIVVFSAQISQHVFKRVGVLPCRKRQLLVEEHLDAFFA